MPFIMHPHALRRMKVLIYAGWLLSCLGRPLISPLTRISRMLGQLDEPQSSVLQGTIMHRLRWHPEDIIQRSYTDRRS
jgi:hypothetical protein